MFRLTLSMCTTTQNAAVINTGSMAAVAANPEQCSYVATKHALLGFSMSAFEVLRHHGCKVCIINPGARCWLAVQLVTATTTFCVILVA